MPTPIDFDDLDAAMEWASVGPGLETKAFICRSTGRIFLQGPDGPEDDDFPENVEDDTKYLPVPHKNRLDLGRPLVLRFIDERAPRFGDEVRDMFRRSGAYSRFTALLQRTRLLEAWHAYEAEASRRALEQWAAAHGLIPRSRSAPQFGKHTN
jgi:hypothetical protein